MKLKRLRAQSAMTAACFLCLALIAAACFSCSGSAEPLRVLTYSDPTLSDFAVDQKLWTDFSAKNKDIELIKEELSGQAFHDRMNVYVSAKQMPDVFFIWPSGRSSFIHEQKLAKDLKPLLGNAFLGNFARATLDPANQAGGYLAMIPQSMNYTSVMYVNEKLLAKHGLKTPATWTELVTMSAKLRRAGLVPVALGGAEPGILQSCLFSTIAGRYAGAGFIEAAKRGERKFTDEAFISALDAYARLFKEGILGSETLTLPYADAASYFASGKAAILIDGDWRTGNFITDRVTNQALISPTDQKLHFGVSALPALPGEAFPGLVSAIPGVGYAISSSITPGSRREKAAVKLIEWLYSKDSQRERFESGAYIPSRVDAISGRGEPLVRKQIDFAAGVKATTPVIDGVLPPAVCAPLNAGLLAIGRGESTSAEVAQAMQDAADSLVKAGK